jgi:hypothetical protein
MTRSFRRPAAVVAACATAVLLLAVLGASAQAASLAVCTGTEASTYSPAMTLTSHSGTATYADTFNCTTSDPGAATGSSTGTYIGPYSCLDQFAPLGTGDSQPFTWADTTTSTFTYTSVVNQFVAGSYVLTATGSITGGKFTGAAATLVITDPVLSALQCLTPGISSATGIVALTITGT